MTKFRVRIREHLVLEVEQEAESFAEALDMVRRKINAGEIDTVDAITEIDAGEYELETHQPDEDRTT